MSNWYYVQGTERVGPVAKESLKDLFLKKIIDLDSYVWKKGFQNWEHLKDIPELDFTIEVKLEKLEIIERVEKIEKIERRSEKSSPKIEIIKTAEGKESFPEINFNFNWQTVFPEKELFFIKIGPDRKLHLDSVLFGPYSLKELEEAINDNRINYLTLIFAPGMPAWIRLGDTPMNPINLKVDETCYLDEIPLLIAIENDPSPLIALIKDAGLSKCTLLGAGPFEIGKELKCSMYLGTVLKADQLKLIIREYRNQEQKAYCEIVSIGEKAKKVMQNYAE